MRLQARRRFLLASAGFAIGSVFLASALALLLGYLPIGGLTGLIFGALLQVLSLAAGAHAAFALARSFPLSEAASASRRLLLLSLAIVLPVAVLGTGVWLTFIVRDTRISLSLLPAFPLFWGPLSAFAAVGLVFAARELASERMAIVAAVGSGAIVATTLSASGASLLDPSGTLGSAQLAGNLVLVALGFIGIASAFQWDAWAARSRRTP